MKLSQKNKSMVMSYLRSCVAAGLAVYMTGNTDPSDIGKAALAVISNKLNYITNLRTSYI